MQATDRERIQGMLRDAPVKLTPIGWGASLRRFYRVESPELAAFNTETAVAMLSDDQLSVRRYSAMQLALLEARQPVPQAYLTQESAGVVLMEDLGDTTVLKQSETLSLNEIGHLYEQIIDLLIRWSAVSLSSSCPAYWLAFDREKFLYEFHFHVRRLVCEKWAGASFTLGESELLEQFFDHVASKLAQPPWVFVHRDFQSSNLIIDAQNRLRVIDFQDARMGLSAYDLASLLCDSYVSIPHSLQKQLLNRYRAAISIEDSDFEERFYLSIIQRKLHDAGAFVFARMNGKNDFIQYIPGTLKMTYDAFEQLIAIDAGDRGLYENAFCLIRAKLNAARS